MKIDLPILLLCAVVSTCLAASEQSSNGNGDINLSMDVTADIDEQESRAESKQQQQQAASSPFASYSSSGQIPEFGMRNPSKSGASVQPGDQQGFAHYEQQHHHQQQQQQSGFEPISSAYKSSESSSGVVTREFMPSVFRKPLFESGNMEQMSNAESDQSYGQAQTLSNEMDSPFYSKTTGQQQNNGDSSPFSSQDNGGDAFSPLMSVEDAFRKYFPVQKDEEQQQQHQQQHQGASPDGYSQQQPGSQPQGQTQYITTYADAGESAQPPQPTPTKELFSIDSLREIVEKQPLARPSAFDPPSPPLSAFLPAPPPGTIIEKQDQSSSQAIPQYGLAHAEQQQQQQQQQHQQHQQLQSMPSQQFTQHQLQQQISQIQQYLPQSQPQSEYVYTKETIVNNVPAPAEAVSHAAPIQEEGGDVPDDENEDEGLPYATDNLDENGKKVSYVYSRPVRLPDVTRTKVVESGYGGEAAGLSSGAGKSNGPYTADMETMVYRKPVSYENDEDSVDHGEEGGPLALKQTGGPSPYEEVDSQGSYGGVGVGNGPKNEQQISSAPFQQGVLSIGQPPQSYQDEGNYGSRKPEQPQWTGANDNRPDFADPSKDSNRPHSIEYGGFVPIKKPGQQGGGQGQGVNILPASDAYLERPQKQAQFEMSQPKNFFPEQRPFSMPSGPDNGYVGPNNISPSGQSTGPMPGHLNFPPPQQNGPKFGGHQNVNNFMSKLPNMRFKPLYGKDAMKKLRELGINEDEFYGTVNKILQKSHGNGPRPGGQGGPFFGKGQMPFMPKANMYRPPPKNDHNGPRPMIGKMRPLSNAIGDEFDFNYFKDGLPQGASYNPRDVGLDESVLSQIHLQDSGIGGYRFPTMIPTGTNILSAGSKSYRPNRPLQPFKKGPSKLSAYSQSVPHAMNSMALPFVLTGPRPFAPRRVPYSATGKGFRSQYGYRAAASELKPQFVLPKPKPFKFLGQPVALSSSNANPLLAGASFDDSANALGNIFGIRSIKGIKSLVSYLTGGVSG